MERMKFGDSVARYTLEFMTACEDLKRFDKEIQNLNALEFPSHDIIEQLVKMNRDTYNRRITQLLEMRCSDKEPWKNPYRELVDDIRRDINDLLSSIDSIKRAHGKIDEYKDAKDEVIENLRGEIRTHNEEIKRWRQEVDKKNAEIKRMNDEIESKNAEIEALRKNLSGKVVVIENMKQSIVDECLDKIEERLTEK